MVLRHNCSSFPLFGDRNKQVGGYCCCVSNAKCANPLLSNTVIIHLNFFRGSFLFKSSFLLLLELCPLPCSGPALTLLRGLAVFGEPLATDVLHHRVLCSFSCLQDVLDQWACPARVQLYSQQVRWPQFTAQQVGFDLHTKKKSPEWFHHN